MVTMRVPFGDLRRQNEAIRETIDAAIARVLDGGWYVLGEEVRAFEAEFAAYCGSAHCVGVASGFEALHLALAALQVGPGDEVITVANACMYGVAPIVQLGATPVLVDVDPLTGLIDAGAVAAAITPRTRAVIPVHLFGRLAPMPTICALADCHGIAVIEDAAQAHGAWTLDAKGQTRKAGQWGTLACFSFYPTKNLGALGDAGAVVTSDPTLAKRLHSLRMYGWSSKYNAVEPGGRNSRLDELQAAVLRVKLRHLDRGNAVRRERAAWYRALLGGLPLALPADEPGHIYHLYVLTLPNRESRERLRERLRAMGIGCDVHYPLPVHLQPAYTGLGYSEGVLPVTESLAGRILSLPMFPELTRGEIEQVASAVATGVAS